MVRKKQTSTREEKIAENYFPVDKSDLKYTVEKQYKKPDVKSLETIEQLKKPKKTYKKQAFIKKNSSKFSKKTYTNPKISLKKNGYELIITEKPQAASKIAQALGNVKSSSINKIPYYEVNRQGKKILVACAVGHLFTLSQSSSGNSVPIFDISWVPNFLVRKKDFTKRYYDAILKLAKNAGSITIATDYDIEGEVIGFNVMRFLCNQKDANRMKFSTLTPNELNKAYDNKSKTINWGQAIAGETRHYLDWFYGINLSRALMNAIKSTGRFRIMSIGRVQGPALNLIVQKEKQIQAFKSETYWQIFIKVKNSHEIELKHNKDIFNKKELSKFENLKGKTAIAKTTKKQQIIPPQPPFNLTTLQTEAYKFYGITPSQTLRIAQSLYLAGLISYPRTSSQKLPDSIEYKPILKKLAKQYNVEHLIKKDKPIEGKKTDPAHPCFTEDTKIKLEKGNITFSEILKKIEKWNYDKQKKSFYSDIKIQNIKSYDHIHKVNTLSSGYKIYKTPYKSDLIYFKDIGMKVTPNHKIYSITKKGVRYSKANELQKGNYVFQKKHTPNRNYKIKISKRALLKAYSKNHQKLIYEKKTRISTNFKEVDKYLRGLSYEKIINLSKIVGFCMGDGHISFQKPSKRREPYPAITFIGKKEDMEKLKEDVNKLGFSSYLIKKDENYYYLSSKNSKFGRTLIALGCPTGDKVSTQFNIPPWIRKSPKEIKSAFIGGLFSAELTKTRIHSINPRDIISFTFTQNKIKKLKKGFESYLITLKKILREFKIETNNIRIKDKIIRKKDSQQTIEGGFDIKNNKENLIKFLSKIDFGYCEYKEKTYRKTLAYLLYRNILVNERIKLKKKSEKLYSKGLSFKEIGEILKISEHTIKGWLYYQKSEKENHVSIKELPKFKDFSEEIPECCIPIKIEKKNIIKFKGHVYDLEIKETHTYFANDILVHNCVYPTGETQILSGQEEKIYNLIVKRFLSLFCDSAIINNKTITAEVDKLLFSARGSSIEKKAWLSIYPSKSREIDLPDLNGEVKIINVRTEQKETQPPKRYSPASILSELEKKNLGTKATRSAILETLYDRAYISEQSIQATQLGISLIASLEKYSPIIIDEQLTRSFEQQMDSIIEAKKEFVEKEQKIIEKAKQTITQIAKQFEKNENQIGKNLLQANEQLREQQKQESKLIQCPVCKKGDLAITYSKKNRRFFIACDAYPNCKTTFSLPPNSKIKKTDKTCEHCNYPMLMALRTGKRPWFFCFNPQCETNRERMEAYREKHEREESGGEQEVYKKKEGEEGEGGG